MIVNIADVAGFLGSPALAADANLIATHAGVERQVCEYLRRQLVSEPRVEYPRVYDTPSRSLYLAETPVETIAEVAVDPYDFLYGLDSIVPLTDIVFDAKTGRLVYKYGLFPAVENSVRVTYTGGYKADVEPKLPDDIRLAILKQCQLEWEHGGSTVTSASIGDVSKSFAVAPAVNASTILDPGVRALLRPHRFLG